MKNKITTLACALALGAALVHPNQAAAQTSKPVVSLADFKKQLMMLQTQVSATAASLNDVKESAKNPAELTRAAAGLDTTFNALQAQVDSIRSNAITVKACVKSSYEAWSKELTEIGNAKIREKAQGRLTDSQKQFDKIIATAAEAKEEVLPFVSDAKDIVIYLGADLSGEAVETLSGAIWKLGNRSRSVNSSIGDVIEQIDRTIKGLPQS
jgi:hypothetical protein